MFIGLRQFRFVIISSLVFAVVGCGHKQHTSPSHKVSSASLSLSPLSPFTPNSQASVQSTDFKTELSQALGAQAGGSVYSQQSLTITANGIGSGLNNFNISGQYLQITDAKNCSATFSGPGDAQRSCVVHVQPSSSTAVDSTETTLLQAIADDSDSHQVSALQAVTIKAKTQPKPGALGITVASANDLKFTKEILVKHLQVSLVNCMPGQAYALSLANKNPSGSSSWLTLARNSTTVTCGAAGSVKNQPISLQVSAPVPTTNSSVSFNLKAQGSSQDPSQGQQVLSAQLHASWTVEPPAKTKLTLMVTDTATPPHSGAQDDPIPLATAAATAVNLTLTCDPSSSANSYPLNISLPADTALSITDKDGGASVPTSIQCGAANPISIKVSIAPGKTLQPTDKLSIDINKQGTAGSKSTANAVSQAVYFSSGDDVTGYQYVDYQAPMNYTPGIDHAIKPVVNVDTTSIASENNGYVAAAFVNEYISKSTSLPDVPAHQVYAVGGAGYNIANLLQQMNSMDMPESMQEGGVDVDDEGPGSGIGSLPVYHALSSGNSSDLYKLLDQLAIHYKRVSLTVEADAATDLESCLNIAYPGHIVDHTTSAACTESLKTLMTNHKNLYLHVMNYFLAPNIKTSKAPVTGHDLFSQIVGQLGANLSKQVLVGVEENADSDHTNSQNVAGWTQIIKELKLGGIFVWGDWGNGVSYNDNPLLKKYQQKLKG